MKRLVDEALNRALPPETAFPADLHKAMRYAVFPGGKRVRPLLVLGSALAVGRRRRESEGGGRDADGDERMIRRAMPCAVSVELVHSYSLIHDDLPAMDDDDFRRGRPTVHRAFGEAVAILAGDALLSLSFQVLSEREARRLMGLKATASVVWEIARASGSLGMAGGQAVDMSLAGRAKAAVPAAPPHDRRDCRGASLSDVERLADLKTGALIRAAVRCGAIAAGAREDELDALTRYGELFGRAFQVFDDVADASQDDSESFPRVMGTAGAREYGARLVEAADDALALFGEAEASELRALAKVLAGTVA
jgi:geranylgeranyl diphosphate synthase type II